MRVFRNLTLIVGGLICAMIMNHYNVQELQTNWFIVSSIYTFLGTSVFGMYLLVSEK